jgi:hypothetical protein
MICVDEIYTPRVVRSRDAVADAGILRTILNRAVDAQSLERFLIEYCSLGVQITQPVEDWIQRAGRRCSEIGLPEIGTALCDHAAHEAGHHLMFIEDTKALVTLWNTRRAWPLDAETLIARSPTRAMQDYMALHEETIVGPRPFGQVAIELEIERLSVVLVPKLLAQVELVLGNEVAGSLSFLRSHGELDIGHTHLNSRIMESLLRRRPEAAEELARVGAEAMFIYMRFFDECWQAALRDCAKRRPASV